MSLVATLGSDGIITKLVQAAVDLALSIPQTAL
jgi:hypothetical protein